MSISETLEARRNRRGERIDGEVRKVAFVVQSGSNVDIRKSLFTDVKSYFERTMSRSRPLKLRGASREVRSLTGSNEANQNTRASSYEVIQYHVQRANGTRKRTDIKVTTYKYKNQRNKDIRSTKLHPFCCTRSIACLCCMTHDWGMVSQ